MQKRERVLWLCGVVDRVDVVVVVVVRGDRRVEDTFMKVIEDEGEGEDEEEIKT
jgi:hypothetical protein